MQLPSKSDLLSAYQTVSNRVKQYAKNLSPLEIKVEEATSNEPWGPHGSIMAGDLSNFSSIYKDSKFRQGTPCTCSHTKAGHLALSKWNRLVSLSSDSGRSMGLLAD